jgi:hypothetical protein
MPFDAPFKIGPFFVDPAGRLMPSDPDAAPAFLFRWKDRVVRARLAQADPVSGRLKLQVTIGRVPSTASTPDETLRPRSFALLHWLGRSAPAGWRLALLADHRVWLEAETPIALPITAVALVTELTRFALHLAPYIDLLDESGLRPQVAPHSAAAAT